MSFLQHFFNGVSDLVNESRSGAPTKVLAYGYNWEEFANGEAGPINFWTSTQINEDVEDVWMTLQNPLVIETTSYGMGDIEFETECIKHAVEGGHDSVVVDTEEDTYFITVDFDESVQDDLIGYIAEAGKKREGPLAGKRISPEKRAELQQKRVKSTTQKPVEKPKPTPSKGGKKSPPKGIKVDVLLRNTGKLSPDRVERAMKDIQKRPPKITGAKENQGLKYFRAEYNFRTKGSGNTNIGYGDVSQDKVYTNQMFCSCADFAYRLYAPYVKVGLSTWNVPPRFKAKQTSNMPSGNHNHQWTDDTNPAGKLFLCKHLWAFYAYYIEGGSGNVELDDEDIEDIVDKYFVDVDGDGDEEVDTEFSQAFGKLYVGQQGKDIEHIEDPEEAKAKKGTRQTFYQLPKSTRKADTDPEDADTEEPVDPEDEENVE